MLECGRTALADALIAVSAVVKDRHTIPILQNVLLARAEGSLQVSGSNLDSEIVTGLPAGFGADWQDFTCPVGQVRDFVKAAPAESIRIEPVTHDGKLSAVNVLSGRSKLKINTLPASDYPRLDTGALAHGFTIDGGVLKAALSAVAYAICADKDRVAIQGALFEAREEGLYLVATDGKRLEQRLIRAVAFDDGALGGFPRVSVPKSGVDRILGLVEDERDITIEVSDRKLRATVGSVTMLTKLMEVPFPDYRRLLPGDLPVRAYLSGKALSGAVTRSLLATPDASKGMVFRFGADGLSLSARDFANGEAEDAIDAEAGEPVVIAFNGRQVLDVLKHLEGDRVEILMRDKTAPAILRPAGDDDNFTLLQSMNVPGMMG